MNNEELLKMGDIDRLYNKNIAFTHYIANKFRNTGIEYEDIISICNVAFVKAIKNYNGSTQFLTYYSRIATNEILMECRKLKSKKQYMLEIVTQNNEVFNLLNIIPDKTDIESEYIAHEQDNLAYKQTLTYIDKLKLKEREMVQMYIAGNTQYEISKKMMLSQSSTSRELKRICEKLKRIKDMEMRVKNEKFFD